MTRYTLNKGKDLGRSSIRTNAKKNIKYNEHNIIINNQKVPFSNTKINKSQGKSMAKFSGKLVNSSGLIKAMPGDKVSVWAEFQNNGSERWDQNTKLGTWAPQDRQSIFADESWMNPIRVMCMNRDIFVGDTIKIEFTIKIPESINHGKYKEPFSLVQENITWFNQPEAKWELNIQIGDVIEEQATPFKKEAAPSHLKSNKLPSNPKICILSTWNIKCGISQYCKHIYNALVAQDYEVTIFDNNIDYEDMYNFIVKLHYDIVIIQYELSIIKNIDRLIEYIRKIKSNNAQIKIYFVIHSENKKMSTVDGLVDGFIYHKNNKLHFKQTKVHLIPMGVPVFAPKGDSVYYRKKYDVPEDAFVISTVGFMFKWKKYDVFLDSIARHLRNYNIIVQLLTSHHSINFKETEQEDEKIKSAIHVNKIYDKVIHITTYVSQQELSERLYMSDLGFLWSGIETESSSASLKEFVSARLPLVKTNSNHYHDINTGCITVAKDMDKFIAEIIGLYNNKNALVSLKNEIENHYNALNYSNTIQNFIDIFNK